METNFIKEYKGYEISEILNNDGRPTDFYIVSDDEDYISEDMRSVKDCENWIDTYMVEQ